MATRPALATQADVTRAIKGVRAAGVPVERIAAVRVTKEGVIITFGEPGAAEAALSNEWDEVLK